MKNKSIIIIITVILLAICIPVGLHQYKIRKAEQAPSEYLKYTADAVNTSDYYTVKEATEMLAIENRNDGYFAIKNTANKKLYIIEKYEGAPEGYEFTSEEDREFWEAGEKNSVWYKQGASGRDGKDKYTDNEVARYLRQGYVKMQRTFINGKRARYLIKPSQVEYLPKYEYKPYDPIGDFIRENRK